MVLLLLVPFMLPYLINPIFSQVPQNESQATPFVFHSEAFDNKPVFVPASNSDHHFNDAKVDNPEIKPDKAETPNEEHYHADAVNNNQAFEQPNAHHENNQDEYLHNDNKKSEPHENSNVDDKPMNARQNTYNDGVYREKIIKQMPTTRKQQMNRPQLDEGVVFVPERNYETRRNDDDDEYRSINDVMNGRGTKKLSDIVARRGMGSAETVTEPPSQILFVSGKNSDNAGTVPEAARPDTHVDARKNAIEESTPEPIIDCKNLNCDTSTDIVCAVKKDDKKFRFRVFKNQCYLRKVNCRFTYDYNRYMIQPLDKCKHIGNDLRRSINAHGRISPFLFTRPKTTTPLPDMRRRFVYRRSMNLDMNGITCQHVCPSSCPEQYNPQCATNDKGERRVFLNHCKLDHHSCSFNTAWHEKPLSECIGSGKAEVRQNRGFIGWMQRVGIVDGKGKVVFE